MKRACYLVAAFAFVVLASDRHLIAGVAVDLNSNQLSGYFDTPDDRWSLGFEFTTNDSIYVTDLGYWGTNLTHDVGIFDGLTQALLVSSTVAAGTPLDSDGFGYVPVSPYLLEAGKRYVISATSAGPADPYIWTAVPAPTYDPAITFNLARYTASTTLVYPDIALTDGRNAYFGPNFQFAHVPEPMSIAVWSFLGLIGGATGAWHRRRTNERLRLGVLADT